MDVMALYSNYLNLNFIEKIWEALARIVNAYGKKYNLVNYLNKAFESSWERRSKHCIKHHVASMQKRCREVARYCGLENIVLESLNVTQNEMRGTC